VFPAALKHDTRRRNALPWALQVRVPADPDEALRTGPDDSHSEIGDISHLNPPSSDPGHQEGIPLSEQGDINQGGHPDGDDAIHPHARAPHAWVGISLILGFVLMYLIDTLPRHATTPSQPQRFPISLNQFSFNRTSSLPNDPETAATPTHNTFATYRTSSTTTVGLVIHAAADGIALGASSASSPSSKSNSNLSLIIFLALMIHKAPAAFGLTSVLLKQGLSKRSARAHLIIFALAAPAGALLTWLAAHLLGYSSSSSAAAALDGVSKGTSTEFATGVLLLFSGGTFLYVAMHTMQESSSDHRHDDHHHATEMNGNGYAGVPMNMYDETAGTGASSSSPKRTPPRLVETLVTVAGMLLPLLMQFGHAH